MRGQAVTCNASHSRAKLQIQWSRSRQRMPTCRRFVPSSQYTHTHMSNPMLALYLKLNTHLNSLKLACPMRQPGEHLKRSDTASDAACMRAVGLSKDSPFGSRAHFTQHDD